MSNGAATLVSLHDTPALLYLRADITPIYGDNASIAKVEREVLFFKAQGAFVVMDRADTSGGAEAVWQMSSPISPTQVGAGWAVNGATGALEVTPLFPETPDGVVLDWPSLDGDMNGGFRLDVTDPAAGGQARFSMLLSTKGNVVDVTPTSSAGSISATITFDDSASAEVAFGADTAGGTLKLTSGGVVLFDGPLPEGIDMLPLFDAP
jgi:hypothetical protein